MKSLVGAYGAGEQKVVGGSQEVSKQMATTLDVRLSSPVISIDQTDLNSAVRVTTASGQVFRSSYVISALPQTLLNRIAFAPPLPWKKLQLIQRIPMGSVIKVMTFYERAFWKENLKLSGAMSTCSGPVCNTMDDTKPGGLSPCIVGFISGEYARLSCDQTVEERKQCVLRQYADVFQSDEFLYPTDYVEKNWMEDEYSGGCFLSGFPPGVLMGFGDAIRQPVGRVHFAGTESARVCIGFMEGALESGERAAEEVFYEQIKKSCQ
jgi:monoamine oxidase